MIRIFEEFEKIHNTQGRNEKLELIENLMQESDLRADLTDILRYTYDPYKTFGITLNESKVKTTASLNRMISDDELPEHWEKTKKVLDQLANRELTGHAAQNVVDSLIQPLPSQYKKWWIRIINRNLRITGIAAKSWSKHVDGLVNAINPQLCEPFDNRTIDTPMIVEPKYDGIRAIFIPQPDTSTYIAFSREGKRLSNTESLCELLAKIYYRDVVIDGEVFFSSFHETQSITSTQSVHPNADKLQLFAFDAIDLSEWNAKLSSQRLTHRKETLREIVNELNDYKIPTSTKMEDIKCDPSWPVQFVPVQIISTNATAEKVYRKYVSDGFEGIILKEMASPYIFKRSKVWMKMKPAHESDIRIIDAIEGQHRLIGSLGAIIVEGTVTFNSRPFKIRSEVGTGFSDKDRAALWADHERGELVGRIAEVRYQEPDVDGALRFPVFVRMRDDRTEPTS